jgi:hypothetical protein
MRLSFDLDGVVADGETGLLSLIHDKENGVSRRHTYWERIMRQYYARRRVLHDPREFVGPDDSFILVSGRVPQCHETTRRWVRHHFGGNIGLHLVCTNEITNLFILGRDIEASELLGELKADVLQREGVNVHFDNNPTIVRMIRSRGIPTVQVGGGIA